MSMKISAEMVFYAYQQGVFPMGHEDGQITWHEPDPRGILPVKTFHVPRSLKKEIEKKQYRVTSDRAFIKVMECCAKREETWITAKIIKVYEELYHAGHAHSVEVWREQELVGGLYGVSIAGAFFGESMFSLAPQASKIGLAYLGRHLAKQGYQLHDTQWLTPHLAMFGGVEVSVDVYQLMLEQALHQAVAFGKIEDIN